MDVWGLEIQNVRLGLVVEREREWLAIRRLEKETDMGIRV